MQNSKAGLDSNMNKKKKKKKAVIMEEGPSTMMLYSSDSFWSLRQTEMWVV